VPVLVSEASLRRLVINLNVGRLLVFTYFKFQLIIVTHIHLLHVKDVFRVVHTTDDFIVI
jgi:hypothetical protein